MKVLISEREIDAVISKNGDRLMLSFPSNMTLAEIDSTFQPDNAREIRVFADDGEHLYKNLEVTFLSVNKERDYVNAELVIDPLEITEAERLKAENEELKARLEKIEAVLAAKGVSADA